MVTPKHIDFFRVFDFVSEKQADGLYTLPATINIIAQEEIGGGRRKSTVLEHPQHVEVLSMDVAADADGSVDGNQHGLAQEHRLC
jgi:hypothetical protein